MPSLYALLIILILASLLTGCTATANAQAEDTKAVDSDSRRADTAEKTGAADLAATEVGSHAPPESCPITRAPDVAYIPPEPYPSAPPARYENQFWYGRPELWTMLSTDGTWYALPQDKRGYTQKVFWWSRSFDRNVEPYPAFTVILERLDADVPSSPVVATEEATNASADFGVAMLTGIEVPSPGCWKVTGQYKDSVLSFVVWVAP